MRSDAAPADYDGDVTTTDTRTPDTPARIESRGLGVLLVVGGLLGLVASATLAIERIELLKNPDYVPSCNFGAVLSCSNVMESAQAEAFGFSNPLIGLVCFPIVVTIGAIVISGVRLPEWIWAGLQIGVVFGVAFVTWLQFHSFFTIKFLCPWCILVWFVTIPIFWYVTMRNLGSWAPENGIVRGLRNWHALVLSLWLLAVAAGILFRNFA